MGSEEERVGSQQAENVRLHIEIVATASFHPCSNPDDTVHAKIPFAMCVEKFSQPQLVEDFYSSALKQKTTARK